MNNNGGLDIRGNLGGTHITFPSSCGWNQEENKPPSPYKFNPHWFKDEGLANLVEILWIPYDKRPRESMTIQF
jgi:hypothetical protein